MPTPLFLPRRAPDAPPALPPRSLSGAAARGREAGSLVLAAVAAFTTLALASFEAHPARPEAHGPDWVGPVGASLAGALVGAVGVVAWALVLELGLLAWPLLRGRASRGTLARLAGDLLIVLIGASLVHVAAPDARAFGELAAGGTLGELFGELLRSLFSTVGSFLVGLTAVGLILIGRSSLSLAAWLERARLFATRAARLLAVAYRALVAFGRRWATMPVEVVAPATEGVRPPPQAAAAPWSRENGWGRDATTPPAGDASPAVERDQGAPKAASEVEGPSLARRGRARTRSDEPDAHVATSAPALVPRIRTASRGPTSSEDEMRPAADDRAPLVPVIHAGEGVAPTAAERAGAAGGLAPLSSTEPARPRSAFPPRVSPSTASEPTPETPTADPALPPRRTPLINVGPRGARPEGTIRGEAKPATALASSLPGVVTTPERGARGASVDGADRKGVAAPDRPDAARHERGADAAAGLEAAPDRPDAARHERGADAAAGLEAALGSLAAKRASFGAALAPKGAPAAEVTLLSSPSRFDEGQGPDVARKGAAPSGQTFTSPSAAEGAAQTLAVNEGRGGAPAPKGLGAASTASDAKGAPSTAAERRPPVEANRPAEARGRGASPAGVERSGEARAIASARGASTGSPSAERRGPSASRAREEAAPWSYEEDDADDAEEDDASAAFAERADTPAGLFGEADEDGEDGKDGEDGEGSPPSPAVERGAASRRTAPASRAAAAPRAEPASRAAAATRAEPASRAVAAPRAEQVSPGGRDGAIRPDAGPVREAVMPAAHAAIAPAAREAVAPAAREPLAPASPPTVTAPAAREVPAAPPVVARVSADYRPAPAPSAPRPERAVIVPAVGQGFRLPSTGLLEPAPPSIPREEPEALLGRARELEKVLANYGVKGAVADIHTGPTVSTFEVIPAEGTKVSKVASLADDLALGLSCTVRIIAPIPGKSRIGFELPNRERIPVNLRELVEDRRFKEASVPLPVVLGRDIVGAPYYADLASMPHVIVAGATGAGKSVGLNVMLTSLLTRRGPDELRMLMIDPKVVELAPFDRIPHMLLPVVTDMKQAATALKWAVDEMERRYQLFAGAGTKNIGTYNAWVGRARRGEVKAYRPSQGLSMTAEDGSLVELGPGREPPPLPEPLPYIVLVVDEFADLMMQQGKDVEAAVARLAQKARAAGMHVILATQRPSVDVITGMIKANFPTRVAFRVAQRVDSRTILDEQGAEHLLGRGDMLVKLNGTNETRRVQCPFISEEEVQRVTDFLRAQGEPVYDENILKPRDDDEGGASADDDGELDPKYDDAVRIVAETRRCSTSWLQRKLGLGYNRAAKIVEAMEKRGLVGPAHGARDREVLIDPL